MSSIRQVSNCLFDPAADAEVIALAVAAMQEAGLTKFQISLGQVDFINGMMAESQLSVIQQQQK